MKIEMLRKLLKKYESTFSVRKWLAGDHSEVISIRQYLEVRELKGDNEELSPDDLYELAGLLPENSQKSLVKAIKKLFRSQAILTLYYALNRPEVLNATLFERICQLSHEHKNVLVNLFCDGDQRLRPTRSAAQAALIMLEHVSWYDYQDICQCLIVLDQHRLIDDALNQWLQSNTPILLSFVQLITLLKYFSILDQASLAYFMRLTSLSNAVSVLTMLKNTEMTIDDEGFCSVFQSEDLLIAVEVLSLILEADPALLTKEMIIFFVNQDFKKLLMITPLLRQLIASDMLTQHRLKLLCENGDLRLVSLITDVLFESHLLKANVTFFDLLLRNEVNQARTHPMLNYLKHARLLNQTVLWCCFKIAASHDLSDIFFTLIENLAAQHLYLSSEQFQRLIFLKKTNLERLAIHIAGLSSAKILSSDTFETVFQLVTFKLPAVSMSTAVKRIRKQTGEARSAFTIDGKVTLFVESRPAKDYQRGSFSKVKMAYQSVDDSAPVYAIKMLDSCTVTCPEAEARREVRYQQLLGRNAFFFHYKQTYCIVSPWYQEKSLEAFQRDELIQLSIEQRLRCLVSAWADVNTLHRYYRMHNDIKYDNFILDTRHATLKLIDFGGAHKVHSEKIFAWTPVYTDSLFSLRRTFHEDLYAMGIVTARLFPELYEICVRSFQPITKLKLLAGTTGSVVIDAAVIALVSNIMQPDISRRATSADALQYCQLLFDHLSTLDAQKLQQIENETIARTVTTIEDVCRESFRAKSTAV